MEHFRRQPGGLWLYSAVEGLERRLELPSIGASLPLGEFTRAWNFRPRIDADVRIGVSGHLQIASVASVVQVRAFMAFGLGIGWDEAAGQA